VTAMTQCDFEDLYRSDPDPWGYRTSRYEREKYAATLAACGPGPFDEALELGGSIGVFSAQLAPRCRRLTTVDFSPTAVEQARERLAAHPRAEATLGRIPEAIPEGPFDLVLASEILYYLAPADLAATLDAIAQQTAAGARLVAVHWRPTGPDRPTDADAVHATLAAQTWLGPVASAHTDQYRLDVLERL
jgi:predicted O-methyltransferase YrrM